MNATIQRLGEAAKDHWGLVTTAEAGAVGVSRVQVSRLCAAGVLIRVAQGVYRMVGAPDTEHEHLYAMWLALGGAAQPFEAGVVPPLVAGGTTAATVHGVGDFLGEGYDFLVRSRRVTRLPGVRLRVRQVPLEAVTFADGMPVLRVEDMLADLIAQWVDRSLVLDTLRDAVEQGKLTQSRRLEALLMPLATRHGFSGADGGEAFLFDLFDEAGLSSAMSR